MSGTSPPQFLVETRGTRRDLGAFVVAARFDRAGRTAAFALGDGTVRLVALDNQEPWREAAVHEGTALALAPHPWPDGFVCGGDDGALRRVGSDGAVGDIARFD